tara:strand:+ start:843 stop:1001 length:159 start_codon:yes stop_codon:yes gene_type:complete
MIKGNYKHAIIFLFFSFTIIAWHIYPFFAKGIMSNFYLKKGYKHLESFATDL